MDSSDEPIVEDLSKWLKPKKTNDRCTKADLSKWLKPRNTNNLSSISPNSALVPPEVIQQKFNSGSTIASKSKFLDYPCLRLESSCWLHKKVPKENVNYNLRTDFSLTLSEKQIIPPTYALPYPFWLKKCWDWKSIINIKYLIRTNTKFVFRIPLFMVITFDSVLLWQFQT